MLAICDAPLRRLSSRAWSPTGSIDMRRRRMQSSPVTLPGRAALAFSSPTRRSASSSFLMRQHDTRILGPAELRARIDRGETGDKVAVAKFGSNVPMKRPGQPAEFATAYVMLADPLSSYVSGATIAVAGGKPFL